MDSKNKDTASTKAKGDFNYTPKDNGAYVDKSYGKNMGNPMQDLIGTEKVENPIKE
jgi:hypothetical protein